MHARVDKMYGQVNMHIDEQKGSLLHLAGKPTMAMKRRCREVGRGTTTWAEGDHSRQCDRRAIHKIVAKDES